MGHIFISYSRKDETYVANLVEALEAEGFEVWIDREMLTGDEWIQVINQKIDECDAFVVVMTDDSRTSKWVTREVLYALQEQKNIFPLLLRGKLWMALQEFNYLDVKDGSLPHKRFFDHLARVTPKTEAWRQTQQENQQRVADEEAEKQKRERERLAARRAEVESRAKEKAEFDRKAKEERDRLARQKAENNKKKDKALSDGNHFFIKIRPALKVIGISIGVLIGIVLMGFLLIRGYKSARQSSTSYPQPTSITDHFGVEMMLVPAGEFQMGSAWYDYPSYSDEKPAQMIYLSAYYIDKYEVTNAAYKVCVEAGACAPPSDMSHYNDSQYDNHPVVYVNWNMAKTYCEWRDARLPTEAQWEKAARGTDGRTYPWGEGINCGKANYHDGSKYCVGDTSEVGSYESGVSPYGLYDMAGNVREWTSSLYKPYPYVFYDGRENLRDSGSRVLRGGSWLYVGYSARASDRIWNLPASADDLVGFRCSRSQ